MKKKFSLHWKSSKQVRKQRKYRYNAPLNIKHKFLSAQLSKELRKKYNKRSLPLRKGDDVIVKIGNFKNTKGKIEKINLRKGKVFVSNVFITKLDGNKVFSPLDPSNLMITELELNDKKRMKILERKVKK